ncbi:hypothetical protein [Scytonema sp. PRP1]
MPFEESNTGCYVHTAYFMVAWILLRRAIASDGSLVAFFYYYQ